MSDAWDEIRKAKEEQYFDKKNKELLKKLRESEGDKKVKLSPITGKPLKPVYYKGVEIDVCEDTGGIWLDNGELEKIIEATLNETKEHRGKWLSDLFGFIGTNFKKE